MSQPYMHVPLKGSYSIRVLSLYPASSHAAPLCCSLAEIPLDPAPEYSALSYSWDAQSPSCPIDCGESVLGITSNCDFALRQLRDEQEVKKFWVDSICIDQTSHEERNQQVALMGDIYKRARQVVVWLGEGNPRTELAMQRLLEIGQVGINSRDRTHMTSTLEAIFGLGVSDASEDPIGPVFERSWFYRMWTMQEVTLPLVENVVVWCGSASLPWFFLLMAVNYLKIAKYKWGKWDEATYLQKHISGLLMDTRQSTFRAAFPPEQSNINPFKGILHILAAAREKKATEPKDKIFALFGVMKDLGLDLPLPDYQKSLEQVYTEAAIACIEHDKCLDILFEAPSDHRWPSLPSWVPDWSDIGWKFSDSRKALLRTRFQAGRSANLHQKFVLEQRRLLVSGILVGSILDYGAPLELDNELDLDFLRIGRGKSTVRELLGKIHPAFSVLRSWVSISSRYEEYPTHENVAVALRRTLLDGELAQNALPISEGAFDAWHEIMKDNDVLATLAAKVQAASSESTVASVVSNADRKAKMEQFPAEWQSFLAVATGPASEYHFAVLRNARKKCFFSTANGYFGIAPSFVQQGDSIAVLEGFNVPVVLRKADEGYRFVTSAYIHGIMFGEAWPSDAEACEITLV